MSLSPTFGSFGDFISLSVLIKDIVKAVDDAHGSAAEYRSLAKDLDIFNDTLQEAYRLCGAESTNPDVQSLHKLAKEAISSCQASIDLFTVQLQKYKSSLGDGNENPFKRTYRKVQWLAEKEDIAKFRAQLNWHSASLNLVFNMMASRMLKANEEARRNDATAWAESSRIMLRPIQSISNTLLNKVGQITLLNHFIYRRLLSIESRIERPIADEMFTFEDAIGRVAPVPLRLVDSWDAFDALLTARFKGLQGFSRVARKRYALQDHRKRRKIHHDTSWQSAMLPGSRVSMSITCSSHETSTNRYITSTCCPCCSSVTVEATSEGTQCADCKLFYTRITEVQDTVNESPKTLTGSPNQTARGVAHDRSGDVEESDDEDASGFTRVQLVPRERTKAGYMSAQLQCPKCGTWIVRGRACPNDGTPCY